MLNLFDPVIYTAEEQAYVETVLKPLKAGGWKDKKNKTLYLLGRIDRHTIIAQGGRCAYCESPLRRGAHAIEHIAPKGIYGEFCYEPQNLVNACTSCNSTSNKGEQDTMAKPVDGNDYAANSFTIVHPYFDNPDEHLKYYDAERTVFDKPACSAKGLETIRMFNWDDICAYNQRVINARTRDLSISVLQMVNEIGTYKG